MHSGSSELPLFPPQVWKVVLHRGEVFRLPAPPPQSLQFVGVLVLFGLLDEAAERGGRRRPERVEVEHGLGSAVQGRRRRVLGVRGVVTGEKMNKMQAVVICKFMTRTPQSSSVSYQALCLQICLHYSMF